MIRLDFETRSDCDLREQGAWVYSHNTSTQVLCMAYEITGPSPPVKGLWVLDRFSKFGRSLPPLLARAIEAGDTLEAHNSFFEFCMWNNLCVPRFDWPSLPPERWQCSASIAAYHALPRSLEGVAMALGLQEQKDKVGSRIMLKLCKPRKPSKNNTNKYFADEKDFETLYQYCKQDVRTQAGVSEALMPLPDYERGVWLLDQHINLRGVHIDREAVEGALRMLGEYQKENDRRIKYLTDGAVTSINQTAKIKKALESQGVSLSGIGRPILESLLKTSLDPLVRKIIELRLSSAKSSTAKYRALLSRLDGDDRVRETVLYHGAHTGRWTGLGIQVQNFPRGTLPPEEVETAIETIRTGSHRLMSLNHAEPMQALSSCLRGMICAPPGHRLIGADYSGIEARFLMWLAGEQGALELFRRGKNLYRPLAATIYNKPVNQVTDKERLLGKQGILGAGYQMGPERFQKTCALYGIDISESMAKRTIQAYRAKYKKVVDLWRHIEGVIAKVIREPKYPKFCGGMLVKVENDFLRLCLPSGRWLHYYKPMLKYDPEFKKPQITYMGVNSVTRKFERMKTYGGSLVENIVQGACRDLLAEAMLRLEKAGYPIVLTVHDEIVAEVPEDFGSQEEFDRLMSEAPDWADDCPLSVKGWTGPRFKK